MEKPAGEACFALRKGRPGCSLQMSKPAECTAYACQWLLGNFDDQDRPDRSGVVVDIHVTSEGRLVMFHLTRADNQLQRFIDHLDKNWVHAVIQPDGLTTELRVPVTFDQAQTNRWVLAVKALDMGKFS